MRTIHTRRSARLQTVAIATVVLLLGGVAHAQPAPRNIDNVCPPGEIEPAGFTDIAGNTHEEAINCLAYYAITSGTSETTYSPSLNVRRDQMASFIARFLTWFIDLPAAPADAFTDDNGNPHEKPINQLADLGVVGGFADGTYRPSATVSRDQMASFINRAIGQVLDAPLSSTEDFFPDDNGNPHEDNINGLASVGIVAGNTAGDYLPRNPVRRDQMASFIMRAFSYLVEASGQPLFTTEYAVLLTGYAVPVEGPITTFGDGEKGNLGAAVIRLNSETGRICAYIETLQPKNYNSAALHAGGMEETAGELLVELEAPSLPNGIGQGCTSVDPAVVAAIEADPTAHYVNLTSSEHPNGALRGQLGTRSMLSYLSWAFEVTTTDTGFTLGAGEPGASGVSFLQIDAETGQVCTYLTSTATAPYAAAHIHEGGVTENGPPVVTFSISGHEGQSISDCQNVDPALLQDIVANPDGYYVNMHNAEYPDGAVRTQVDSAALELELAGENEVDADGNVVGESGKTGTWYAQVVDTPGTDTDQLCYYLETDATGPFTGAHIHEGARGANGDVILDLELPAPVEETDPDTGDVVSSNFTHCVTANATDLYGLDLEQHYLNVHTDGHPDGAVRGQLADGIVPPFQF